MTVVRNKLVDATGAPVIGVSVTATLRGARFTGDGLSEIIRSAAAVTDSTGVWTLTLTPTSQIEGDAVYIVREPSAGWAVVVPDTGTFWLRSVITDPPGAAAAPQGLTRAQADALYATVGSTVTVDGMTTAIDAAITAHEVDNDPHPQYATDGDLQAHIDAPDPHPQYARVLVLAPGDPVPDGTAAGTIILRV